MAPVKWLQMMATLLQTMRNRFARRLGLLLPRPLGKIRSSEGPEYAICFAKIDAFGSCGSQWAMPLWKLVNQKGDLEIDVSSACMA